MGIAAGKRASAAKAYLESHGFEIHGDNETSNGHMIAVLASRNGANYVASINLVGNAVVVSVFVVSYGLDDFASREEAVESIPLIKDGWIGCAAAVNAKMDGLCALTISSTDDVSMSISGVTKGYYLKEAGASEYICKLLNRALDNADAGSALAESYLEAQTIEEAE